MVGTISTPSSPYRTMMQRSSSGASMSNVVAFIGGEHNGNIGQAQRGWRRKYAMTIAFMSAPGPSPMTSPTSKSKSVSRKGTPNIEPRDDIKITDTAPIVRTVDGDREAGELVQRRWSWPGQNRRPIYNFRSENREFSSGRCLIIADGFYEFTDPKDPKKKRKDKWLFTKRGEPWFCIAGIWRSTPMSARPSPC